MKGLSEYTADLRRSRPDSAAAFMCPVCLREFDIESCDAGSVARAHVFPKSVGGSHKTRACKVCDERIGDRVEGQVVNFLRSRRVVLGLAPGKTKGAVTMSMGSITASARVTFEEGKWTVTVPKRGALDDLPAELGVQMPKDRPARVPFRDWPPIQMTLTPTSLDIVGLTSVLALKIAFYSAFELHGYSYILRKDLDWARVVLSVPSGNAAPCVHTAQLRNNPFAPAGDYPGTYVWDSEVGGLRGLFCVSGFWEVGFVTALPPLGGPVDNWHDTCNLGWLEAARVTFPDHVIGLLRDSAKNRPGGRERRAESGMA